MDIETAAQDVKLWEVKLLQPYENNAKLHDKAQIEAIAASIKRFGFDQPIVVDGASVIIKGHGRWLAAQHLGKTHVPVIVRHDLTASEAAASRLADNQVSTLSLVDTDMLQQEIAMLNDSDFDDMEALGFTEKTLDFLTEDLGEMEDAALMLDDDQDSGPSLDDDIAAAGKESVSIKKVLGFDQVPGEMVPKISRAFKEVEAATGTRGAEALVKVLAIDDE